MSAAVPRPHAYMLAYAQGLIRTIAPVCERVEIAGSLRRNKPLVSDIELVAIPIPDRDLFGEIDAKNYSGPLDRLMAGFPLTYTHSGPRNKRFTFAEKNKPHSLISVDLFLCTPDQFGFIYMLRTGSAEFSRRMVTPRKWGGFMPEEYRPDKGYIYRGTERIDVPTEQELFKLWGMKFIQPKKRN